MPTKIEWTDETWNPITGCSLVSAGCDNCYARRMATRLRGRYGYPQDDPFKVTLHPDRLDQPLHWRKPRMIFVCSMGDLFHKDVPADYVCRIFGIMADCPQHRFIILTKRPERMLHDIPDTRQAFPHVWLGISVENQKTADERIPILLRIPAAVRVVSIEPMLGPVNLYSQQDWLPTLIPKTRIKTFSYRNNLIPTINWVICGGETGPGRRPCELQWIRDVKDQCEAAGVPFFLKALYEDGKKLSMPVLDGRQWNQIPEGR